MAFQLDTIAKTRQTPKTEQHKAPGLLQREIKLFGRTSSNKKKEHFYTELSVLLTAGVPLRESLTLLEQNEKKKPLKLFFRAIIDGVISGKTFSEAIRPKKEVTEYEYYSLHIGEETGTLNKVTASLGSFFSGKNQQQRQVINALTYPIIISVTALLVVVFMLRFVVPMFQDIFARHQVALPGVTKFIIVLADFLKAYGGWLLLLLPALFTARKVFAGKKSVKKYSDGFMLRLPVAGRFIKTVYIARFVQAMALLSAAKVPMVNSIALVKKMIVFYPLQYALEQVETTILRGVPLSESLREHTIFDAKMVALVKVAEETNKTEFIFERLYQQYSMEVQQRSKLLATVMEPLIIVFIGILVGIILIAMYLPMFKLSSVVG